MKKNNLINKYDFVNYFTKQPSLWFFSNAEIMSGIELETSINDFDDDEDENEEDIVDRYELYKEMLLNNEDIDKNNPRLIEGNIIDCKSREFIMNQFRDIQVVYDFEKQNDINQFDLYQMAKKTQELIEQNEKIILFQPVFIANNMVTKPDAIIKNNEQIILIETKGTTTAKLYHALDIYFQSKVLRSLDYLQDYYFEYKLCLVAYELAPKNDVSFILSDTFNYTKTPSGLSKCETISQKQLCKLGRRPLDGEEEFYIYLDSICNDSLSDFETKIENSKGNSKTKLEEVMNDFAIIFNSFDDIVTELSNHLSVLKNINKLMCSNINPHKNDKNKYRTNEFMMLKKLYVHKGFDIFKYSGKLVNFSASNICKIATNKYDIYDFATKSGFELIKQINEANNRKIIINHNVAFNLFSKLKEKKVYFDFETISSSIRSINDTVPFLQVVTQCSIIILDETTTIDNAMCNNLFFDPCNITINDYKSMIDSLYRGIDYSYVVYNKSFECSRLKEIKNMINENEYNEKIDVIIKNIYDLADFFMYKKDCDCIPILIKELFGYYSIKKVLPYVEENYNHLYHKVKCKNYHDLEISNGLMCQNLTTLHFLEPHREDIDWQIVSNNMKVYCENDVRAMVAVEYFIKEILNI